MFKSKTATSTFKSHKINVGLLVMSKTCLVTSHNFYNTASLINILVSFNFGTESFQITYFIMCVYRTRFISMNVNTASLFLYSHSCQNQYLNIHTN